MRAGSPARPGPSRDLLDLIATTRAIRRYRPDPVPDDDLAALLDAARAAPSAGNRQPARFLVVRDAEPGHTARRLLGDAFRAAWAAKAAAEAWHGGSGRDPSSPKARAARAMQHYVDTFEQSPVVLLACLGRDEGPYPYETASVYPACQNLLLAAHALGYGGTLSTWHSGAEVQLRALLGIPPDVFIAATITVGRPVGGHGPLRRRPLRELVFDTTWGAPATWLDDR